MKTFSLVIVFFLIIFFSIQNRSFSQSQRLVLVEEFTNDDCGPCSMYNPDFNKLLNANPSKVVAVKYPWNYPGPDPMNAHNAVQIQTRGSYYGIHAVPWGQEDGSIWNNDIGYYTQSVLNSRYAVSSPFTITVSHNLSSSHDSIYAHVVINCTQAVTGNLVAQIAIIERNIYFSSPPGNNGETHFEEVMDKLLPSDQGTTLASSWNVGDSKTIDVLWKTANVYDANQLAVVAWIQDNTTKHVHQAGYSRPNIARDAGIINVSGVNGVTCDTIVNATVTLHNFTEFPLDSVIINSSIDGHASQQYNWSGNLTADASVIVTLPPFTIAGGNNHTIKFYTSMPNGGADLDTHNDAISRTASVLTTVANAPLTQDFHYAGSPPPGWTEEDVNNTGYKWMRSTASYNTPGSATIDCFDAPDGAIYNLYSPRVNFSNAVTGSKLEFDVSHAQCSSSQFERLKVDVSADCGSTWNTIYNVSDPALATVPLNSSCPSFYPTSNSQWRHETVSLDQFNGSADLLVRFQAISGQGNNIYLDNVNVSNGTTGINEVLLDNKINLYPNPTTGKVFLNIDITQQQDITVTVNNLLGATVKTFTLKEAHGLYPFDFSDLPEGNYFITLKAAQEILTKRIFITK